MTRSNVYVHVYVVCLESFRSNVHHSNVNITDRANAREDLCFFNPRLCVRVSVNVCDCVFTEMFSWKPAHDRIDTGFRNFQDVLQFETSLMLLFYLYRYFRLHEITLIAKNDLLWKVGGIYGCG